MNIVHYSCLFKHILNILKLLKKNKRSERLVSMSYERFFFCRANKHSDSTFASFARLDAPKKKKSVCEMWCFDSVVTCCNFWARANSLEYHEVRILDLLALLHLFERKRKKSREKLRKWKFQFDELISSSNCVNIF